MHVKANIFLWKHSDIYISWHGCYNLHYKQLNSSVFVNLYWGERKSWISSLGSGWLGKLSFWPSLPLRLQEGSCETHISIWMKMSPNWTVERITIQFHWLRPWCWPTNERSLTFLQWQRCVFLLVFLPVRHNWLGISTGEITHFVLHFPELLSKTTVEEHS